MSNIIDKIQVSGVTYDIGGGGGGKAIEAGRGIAITTGETADTVSFNLPISASSKSSGNYINIGVFYDFDRISASKFQNISIGTNNIANSNTTIFHGNYNTSNESGSFISGYGCQTNGLRSNAFGDYIVSNNEDELSTGKYNVSNTGSTDADKTLFSVGNGTSSSARHNAFEIRQNGDIYLSSGGTDIKLQDHLGGGGGGGNPTVELTQAEYDALVTAGTVAADTYYIITDAQAGDLTNYYTKTETNTLLGDKADTATTYTKTETDNAITAATSTKQDTLVSGTNIKTINNESILGSGNIDIQGGGGGKAVAAGTNISVTTGETADTINCTIPIAVGNGDNSIGIGTNTLNNAARVLAVGYRNIISNLSSNSLVGGLRSSIDYNCANSIAFGYEANVGSKYSCSIGSNTKTSNDFEAAFGRYNASNTGSTDADKTRFSVGNGTDDNARHNAFEIRQNGDIYLNNGTSDVKLQEYLQIKAVKLTQSEYDSLSTYDSNTLYVIVN